jgi:hypothetical protein
MLMDIDVAAVQVSIFMMDTLMQLCVNIILYDLCIIFEYKPQYTENQKNVVIFPCPAVAE